MTKSVIESAETLRGFGGPLGSAVEVSRGVELVDAAKTLFTSEAVAPIAVMPALKW